MGELVAQVRRTIGRDGAGDDRGYGARDVAPAVRSALRERGTVLGRDGLETVVRAVSAHVSGAGPLQVLLDDPEVSDVLVNGPDEVWVDRGRGLERAGVDLGTHAQVRELAVRLASTGGQRLDDACPMVDARLPDGARLHAVVAPVCERGALISLRVLRAGAFTLAELAERGTVAPDWAPVLEALVHHRANVLVSGATGTGKTTLLGTLLSLVPATQRVVCIEEARELAPRHPHVVALTARRPNVEGAGRVELSELVRTALRMRPDRIVLGECRGAEIREMLMALNTGHEGGWATIHANTAADVPARLDALAGLAGMSSASMATQAASALDAVVHLRRSRGRRLVAELAAVGRTAGGVLEVVPALRWDGARTVVEPGWSAMARRWGMDVP
ncbi:MAG: TadA family conjugal transfer-associated ATPase [Cellulomonadaceae bacterium]